MKSWVEINNRIFEIERMEEKSEEVKKEWNTLLDIKVAGIVKRKKYEVPEGKSGRKKGEKEKGQGKDVDHVSGDMGGKTSLLRVELDQVGMGNKQPILSPHPA